MDSDRPLTEAEQQTIRAARHKAHLLYEGEVVGHRSCGICMAETFNLPSRSYQALRRGGLTGRGPCGVVQGGRMVLGEILGDPDPAGATTPALQQAITAYEAAWPPAIDRQDAPGSSVVCNLLTSQFADFRSPARASFCGALATDVAGVVAEILLRSDVPFEVTPIEGYDGFDPAAS